MRDKDILSKPARVLTQEERESFFKDGYVVKKKIISERPRYKEKESKRGLR